MRPTNPEIKKVYEKKLEVARAKLQATIKLRENQPEGDSLEDEIMRRGIAVTVSNLNGHITHCLLQIKKWDE